MSRRDMDFAADIAERSRWAKRHNDGHPSPTWSTGEQLAVALVLRDRAYLDAMGYSPQQATQRVVDGMAMPPTDFAGWLDEVRAAVGRSGRSQPTVEQLVRRLQGCIRHHDLHVQAAVELLIAHDVWLRRSEFRQACVRLSAGDCWIDWRQARAAFDAGEFTRASSTEVAVLDFAIALGEDRYRFNYMGESNTRLLIEATTRALGGAR